MAEEDLIMVHAYEYELPPKAPGKPPRQMWRYKVDVPASVAGAGKRKSVFKRGFATRKAAVKAGNRRADEAKKGRITNDANATFAEYVGHWRATRSDGIALLPPEERTDASRFADRTVYTLSAYVTPWLGKVKLEKVPDKLSDHYRMLLTRGGHRSCCHRTKATKR